MKKKLTVMKEDSLRSLLEERRESRLRNDIRRFLSKYYNLDMAAAIHFETDYEDPKTIHYFDFYAINYEDPDNERLEKIVMDPILNDDLLKEFPEMAMDLAVRGADPEEIMKKFSDRVYSFVNGKFRMRFDAPSDERIKPEMEDVKRMVLYVEEDE